MPFLTIRSHPKPWHAVAGHRGPLRSAQNRCMPRQADQAVFSYFENWGVVQKVLKLSRVFGNAESILAIEEQAGNDKRGLLNRGYRWIDLKQLGTIGPHCEFYCVLQDVVKSAFIVEKLVFCPERVRRIVVHKRLIVRRKSGPLTSTADASNRKDIRSHSRPWQAVTGHGEPWRSTQTSSGPIKSFRAL